MYRFSAFSGSRQSKVRREDGASVAAEVGAEAEVEAEVEAEANLEADAKAEAEMWLRMIGTVTGAGAEENDRKLEERAIQLHVLEVIVPSLMRYKVAGDFLP